MTQGKEEEKRICCPEKPLPNTNPSLHTLGLFSWIPTKSQKMHLTLPWTTRTSTQIMEMHLLCILVTSRQRQTFSSSNTDLVLKEPGNGNPSMLTTTFGALPTTQHIRIAITPLRQSISHPAVSKPRGQFLGIVFKTTTYHARLCHRLYSTQLHAAQPRNLYFQDTRHRTIATMAEQVINEVDKSMYSLTLEGIEEPAFLKYTILDKPEGKVYNLTHTYVSPAMRGKGVAAKLVKQAFSHARTENHKIIPTCSYIVTYLDRHPDDKDIVHTE